MNQPPLDDPLDVSVVIPCYGSSQTLPELVPRVIAALEPTALSFEIVLVNDASRDGTWSCIQELASRHAQVRGCDLLYNTGQHRATICGLEMAKGRLLVTMDDDLQQPPEELPRLIEAIRADDNCDCVIAAFSSKRHGPFRNLGTGLMRWLFRLLYDKPPHVHSTSFRVMRPDLVRAVCAFATTNPNLNPLIFQTTRRIASVQVEHHDRPTGRSGYSAFHLIRLMLDNVLGVSTLPLKIVSALGIASAGASVLLGVWYLYRWYFDKITVTGFVTPVLLIIFFGGMSLFSIGILGEYIIRIMEEVRGRPRYIVREHAKD